MKKYLWLLLLSTSVFLEATVAVKEGTNEVELTKLEEQVEPAEEKPIVLVIASYNNWAFYKKNLESALSQKYNNFRIIYTNDASTDGTGEMVKQFMEKHLGEVHFTYFENKERQGAAFNIDRMIRYCEPEEIVCIYDGDDALVDPNVLKLINKLYQDDSVWMSYGQFISRKRGEGKARPMSLDVLKAKQHRTLPWKTFGLRNFYAGLYQSIPKESWMYDGKFLPNANDVLQMYYLLDKAGEHTYFINKPLLYYNLETGKNDSAIRRSEQQRYEKIARDEFPPLEKLEGREEMFNH